MNPDWDAEDRGMTPEEWADVLEAGSRSVIAVQDPGAHALSFALHTMANECLKVQRVRESRHG